MNKLRLPMIQSALLVATFAAAGCSTTPPTIQMGEDAEVSFDGLHKIDNSQADVAWARPDFDISSYSKIMLVSAGISYAPAENRARTSIERSRGGPYFISDEVKARFEEEVSATFADEISKIENFEIVDEAGPDVLMVRGGLIDVVSYVPSDPMTSSGLSSVYLRTVGEATLILELRDSESGTVLARSIDRRAAESAGDTFIDSNRVTNAAEVRRLIRFWGRRLREALDGFSQQ